MNNLKKLANLMNISDQYTDKMENIHLTSDNIRTSLLSSMGFNCSSTKEIKTQIDTQNNKIYKNGICPVYSFFKNIDKLEVCIHIKHSDYNKSANIQISNEHNNKTTTQISLKALKKASQQNNKNYLSLILPINQSLDVGYYNLKITIDKKVLKSFLIIAPSKCYLPKEFSKDNKKVFGLAIQLYAIRSKNNMGIGDFSDLKELIKITAKNGGDIIGINPLSPLFLTNKTDFSPYRGISREYVSFIYIDLKAVADFNNSADIKTFLSQSQNKKELNSIIKSKHVEYARVIKFKMKLLSLMYTSFSNTEKAKNTKRYLDFKDFVKSKGENLQNLCALEALFKQFNVNDWQLLPTEYHNINSMKTKEFIKQHSDKIELFAYGHWLADKQLQEASRLCKDLSMKIGLYLDLPIGAAPSSAEVWQNQADFFKDLEVGAPADLMRPKGQRWGFAPYNPINIAENKYSSFINLIKENLKHAHALRIDHAMGLQRLFTLTNDKTQALGAYIYYNIKDFVAILSLESNISKTIIIAEDLGTVPQGFREYMLEHNLLSNKIFFRQKNADGSYILPKDYQYLSLAQSSTHDQATTSGFWRYQDIKAMKNCKLFANKKQYKDNKTNRDKDKKMIISALKQQNLNPKNLEISVSKYMSQTNSMIFLQRIEDIYSQKQMQNLPGTIQQYPNWRIKQKINIEDIKTNAKLQKIFAEIKSYR